MILQELNENEPVTNEKIMFLNVVIDSLNIHFDMDIMNIEGVREEYEEAMRYMSTIPARLVLGTVEIILDNFKRGE